MEKEKGVAVGPIVDRGKRKIYIRRVKFFVEINYITFFSKITAALFFEDQCC